MLRVVVVAIVLGALVVGACTSSDSPAPEAGPPDNIGAPEWVPGSVPDALPDGGPEVLLPSVVGPIATIEPMSGPPGTVVSITGHGWTAGTQLSITQEDFRGGSPYATPRVAADGSFVASFAIERYPDGTPIKAGRLVFLVQNTDGSQRASADFEVAP